MSDAETSNKFVVNLSGVALSDSDRRQLSALIQAAVLTYLAANVELPGPGVADFKLYPFNGMSDGNDDLEQPSEEPASKKPASKRLKKGRRS